MRPRTAANVPIHSMLTLPRDRSGTGRSDATTTGVAAGPARLGRTPLAVDLDLRGVVRALQGEPGLFALSGHWAGGGAIVGCAPLAVAEGDPFDTLEDLPTVDAGVAPAGTVGGGWFGWLGYRLGARIERLPAGPPRPVALPDFHLAYYDHVLRRDADGRWWFEALVTAQREAALAARHGALLARLTEAGAPAGAPAGPDAAAEPAQPGPLRLSAEHRAHHLAAVRDCRRRIAAGEIYQANLCLRLEGRWAGTASELFTRALETLDPPHAALFQMPWGGLVSLSPELFLRRSGRDVRTAPIKGTIARAADDGAAERARAVLEASGKDAAEHVMIVDLMRNDLGRVCEYGSVLAARPPVVEPHPGLWHLVSPVTGTLRAGAGDGDLLRATFPPGSVTGAPKVQAMHVIAALEPTGREAYTGAIGFASPLAGLELNVAIRTLELRDGRVWMGAGGGIVADSDPERELDEALVKARPIAAAIGTEVIVEQEPAPAAGPRPHAVPRPRPASPDRHAGVFETLLVRDGRIQALDRHLARLARSVATLYDELVDSEQVAGVAERAASRLTGTHRLRIDAVPDHLGIELQARTAPVDPAALATPIVLHPVHVPGGLGAHKWRDRRALERAGETAGVPLILDEGEEVLESAWASVFIVEGRRLLTPPADGRILPGVTRALLLELGPRNGWTVEELPLPLARVRAADAVFLTSSVRHAVGAGWGADAGADAPAAAVVPHLRGVLAAADWPVWP